MIYGHGKVRAYFQQVLAAKRLHHAYLLDGPQGLGKASLAMELAPDLMGGAQTPHLLTSGAHPDFMRLAISEDPKTGKLRREIVRDQVEALLTFLTKHPVVADRKLVLIDAADDLNISAANNLLKWLEEPRPRTCLLLIAHRADRLLPTIRSRCARVRFQALNEDEFANFARDHRLADPAKAFTLSGGVPGRALILRDPKVEQIFEDLQRLVQQNFQADPLHLMTLARTLLLTPDAAGLGLALGLLRHCLSTMSKDQEAEMAHVYAQAYARTLGQEAQVSALNMDPAQVLAALLLDLQELARQGQGHARVA